eukprot:gnl/Dysnectes_brevis/7829_a13505_201.p1 GENE.gnl/Dysnectes_brevis/7829_a13505_201~~gnl/Dysnectes_brevis/7829_a13505_201.p1  ORF type:complete len:526 (-),score=127.17 gnl/Dysnectes_brevis/7829_a13505_201:196-1773(-)
MSKASGPQVTETRSYQPVTEEATLLKLGNENEGDLESQIPRDSKVDETEYVSPIRLSKHLICMLFLTACDMAMTQIALPSIEESFSLDSLAIVQWVTNAYFCAVAGTAVIAGRIASKYGTTRCARIAVLGWMVAQLLTATAQQFWFMIVARALQGMFGGVLISALNLFIRTLVSPKLVTKTMSINMVLVTLGVIVCPAVGGWIIDNYNWRPLYATSLLLGPPSFYFIGRLPRIKPVPAPPIDIGAALLMITSLSTLAALFAAVGVGQYQVALVFLAIVGVTMPWFIVSQWRSTTPIFPVRLLRPPLLQATTTMALCNMVASWGLLLPFILEIKFGLSSTASGVALAISPLMAFVGAIVGGSKSTKVVARRLSATGLLVSFVGLWIAVFAATRSGVLLVVGQAVVFMGWGLTNVVNTSYALLCTPRRLASHVAGLPMTARMLGNIVGQAISTSVHSMLLRAIYPYDPDTEDPAYVDAYAVACQVVIAISALWAFIGMFVVWSSGVLAIEDGRKGFSKHLIKTLNLI